MGLCERLFTGYAFVGQSQNATLTFLKQFLTVRLIDVDRDNVTVEPKIRLIEYLCTKLVHIEYCSKCINFDCSTIGNRFAVNLNFDFVKVN